MHSRSCIATSPPIVRPDDRGVRSRPSTEEPDLDLHLADYGQIVDRIKDFLGEGALVLKNEASMVYHRSHVHQLAKGLKDYLDKRNQLIADEAQRVSRPGGRC